MNARVRAIAVAGALIAATVGVYGYAAEPGLLEPASAQNCDPNDSPCIPNTVGDALNCGDIGVAVRVIGVDHNNFDSNEDGTGCESFGTPPPAPTVPPATTTTTTTTPPVVLPPSLPPQPTTGCAARPVVAGTGLFVPITPARILDTRTGPQFIGALRAPATRSTSRSPAAPASQRAPAAPPS